jgi:hypothetical protein
MMPLCVASLLEEVVFEVFVHALHPMDQAVSAHLCQAPQRYPGLNGSSIADL